LERIKRWYESKGVVFTLQRRPGSKRGRLISNTEKGKGKHKARYKHAEEGIVYYQVHLFQKATVLKWAKGEGGRSGTASGENLILEVKRKEHWDMFRLYVELIWRMEEERNERQHSQGASKTVKEEKLYKMHRKKRGSVWKKSTMCVGGGEWGKGKG